MKILILLCLSMFLTSALSAKPKDKKKKSSGSSFALQAESKDVSISAALFSNQEMKILEQYVDKQNNKQNHKQKKLPKGLQKKMARGGTLPPGWQKKLNKGSTIDKETYLHAKPLPKEIILQLPKSPVGTITVAINGEIVRLAQATMTIIDVLSHH